MGAIPVINRQQLGHNHLNQFNRFNHQNRFNPHNQFNHHNHHRPHVQQQRPQFRPQRPHVYRCSSTPTIISGRAFGILVIGCAIFPIAQAINLFILPVLGIYAIVAFGHLLVGSSFHLTQNDRSVVISAIPIFGTFYMSNLFINRIFA